MVTHGIILKQTLSILTIILFLLPTIGRIWIVIDFKIHQDYIAKVLCVNKDKPDNTCNGKCHLKKQLKKAQENPQSETSKNFKENSVLNLFLPEFDILLKSNSSIKEKQKQYFNTPFKRSGYINKFFRPPKFLLQFTL
ncbi:MULTISPECIES: hypothetical protein [unclassified Saccharicrinis]|uniref:hypothetical protein n=1 Tax=unclassified Saccharicrinis TaxID=2646859 RepID=UPI003D3516AA